ncbi:lipopolysaccharide assembly protein LapB [Streptomyces sp. FH025]|uniref:tetratricopeptide repeat protein n=1 Tax=Streptomyces sp. FH025 TaxID=2815937 RepID=UPI001A9FA080|nr:tetratricopeptide repeat protein [Streptomyces sp. FH025]MBO1418576.1 tetratricopeptide repeat protein [Streptomyces sp. FH025]
MAARERTPNGKLSELVAECRWASNGEFARAVNRAGNEAGYKLRYDESAVSHWLSGTRPMTKYQKVVLETLTRRLRRPVTAFEAGFADEPDVRAQSGDTVAGLIDLGSMDMDPSRRGVLGAGLYSVALTIPGWPDVVGRFERLKADPHTRIGMAEVEAVIAMTERISELDDQFGGRTARPMAAAFMVNNIAPHLKATAADEVRKAMLSAAGDHLYLTGYMAVDERLDLLGQAYYTKALELALAQTGDRTGALAKLHEAEVALEQAESKAKAHGSYDPASLSYHVAQVNYELGDREGAIRALQHSEKVRPTVYRRARVRHRTMLAEWQLEAGRLEEAVQNWHLALDDFPHVQSGRADDRFRTMLSATQPHHRNPHVRELLERARQIAPHPV